jgi:hypothetical protein
MYRPSAGSKQAKGETVAKPGEASVGEVDANRLRGVGVAWGGRRRFVIDGGACKLETTGLTRSGVMSLAIKMGQTKLLVVMAVVM